MGDAVIEMDTALDIGLELIVNEAFDEEQACEHSDHNEDSGVHEGSGNWYVTRLHECTYGVIVFCDKFVQYLFSMPEDIPIVYCVNCFKVMARVEAYGSFTRIKDKGKD